jgi:hypothetical protein
VRDFENAFPLPQVNGNFFVPNSVDPLVDNSVYCAPFTLVAGDTASFPVNNSPPPGGDARTIGFWKNWSSCTGGGQDPVLNQTLAMSPLSDPGDNFPDQSGVWIGKLFVNTCDEAVTILDKRSLDGKKRASDAAYEVASQLLAAQLNVLAGARVCIGTIPPELIPEELGEIDDITDLITQAQKFLFDLGFNGTADYLDTKGKNKKDNAELRALALQIAGLLDDYNNNELCNE